MWERICTSPAALPLFEWRGAEAVGEPASTSSALAAGRGRTGEMEKQAGASPNRPAVVLIHGFSGSHREWDDVAPRIGGRARLLAVDLPGHGEAVSAEYLRRCSMERASEAFEAACQKAGVESCLLVGYSLGGRFALYVSLARPHLVGGLILEGAGPGIADYGERRRRREFDQKLAVLIERKGTEAFARHWQAVPIIAEYERLLPDAARRARHEMRLTCSPAGLAASLRGMGAGRQPWLGERLHELAVPVCLVTGARDPKYTRIAQEMTARILSGGNGSPVTACREERSGSPLVELGAGTQSAVGAAGKGSEDPGGRVCSDDTAEAARAAAGNLDPAGVRHIVVEGAGHNVHASHPEDFAGIVGRMLSVVRFAGDAASEENDSSLVLGDDEKGGRE